MTSPDSDATPFQITVQPSGRTFSANAGESLLAAAAGAAGVGLGEPASATA